MDEERDSRFMVAKQAEVLASVREWKANRDRAEDFKGPIMIDIVADTKDIRIWVECDTRN